MSGPTCLGREDTPSPPPCPCTPAILCLRLPGDLHLLGPGRPTSVLHGATMPHLLAPVGRTAPAQLGVFVNSLQGLFFFPFASQEPSRASPLVPKIVGVDAWLVNASTRRKPARRHRLRLSPSLLLTPLHGRLTWGATQNTCQPGRPSTGPWGQNGALVLAPEAPCPGGHLLG